MAKAPKPFSFPKAKTNPVTPPPILKPQQALRQFHTTPVVLPLKQARLNKIIARPIDPLQPKAPKNTVKPIGPAVNPLDPLKTYLP